MQHHYAHPQAAVLRIFRQPPCRGPHQQPGKARSAVCLEGLSITFRGA